MLFFAGKKNLLLMIYFHSNKVLNILFLITLTFTVKDVIEVDKNENWKMLSIESFLTFCLISGRF